MGGALRAHGTQSHWGPLRNHTEHVQNCPTATARKLQTNVPINIDAKVLNRILASRV